MNNFPYWMQKHSGIKHYFLLWFAMMLVGSAITTVCFVAGIAPGTSTMLGFFAMPVIVGADIWYFSVLPHRRIMKRYKRIQAIIDSNDESQKWQGFYLLGLNEHAHNGNKAPMEYAIKKLLEQGIDPRSIDKGEA